jgi:predicted nucleic acid-binding protein
MKAVFADTSYYVALLGCNDTHHDVALQWRERLLGPIVVTEYVLVELGSALSGIRDRQLFAPFVAQLLEDPATIFVPGSPTLLKQGLELFGSRRDKEWSLVDCISFVVMKQRRLKDALTTDLHLIQAGFRALLREGGKP